MPLDGYQARYVRGSAPLPGATKRLMRAALPPGKGHFYRILNDCHCFVLRPGAVQFPTQVVEIFPVLNRVFRLCFPGVQQRDQSLDFLELTRHSFTMFLVVIPLREIMSSGLAYCRSGGGYFHLPLSSTEKTKRSSQNS